VSPRALEWPEAKLQQARHRALVPFCPCCHRSMVDRATQLESIAHGPGPRTFLFRNNSLSWLFRRSCKKVHGLLGIQSIVQNFVARPLVLERKFQRGPQIRKIHKIVLQTSNPHIFPTTTPNSVILTPNILESLLLLLSAFIIHMFLAIIYCLCYESL
jgi:hypothetical protein